MTNSYADRALKAILVKTRQFEERFRHGVDQKQSAWIRLAVKLEKGKVKTIQSDLVDQVDIDP